MCAGASLDAGGLPLPPGARQASEAAYRFVADHRGFFSKILTFAWGRDPEPSSYVLSRWIFLRLLGLIYVIAFLSLRVQILGLIGSHGISPAGEYLEATHQALGSGAYRLFPTLAWINSSDSALTLLCGMGALAGLMLMLGILTGPALAVAWLGYLSLVTVGQDFLSFQWDALLLEAGFLAIFLAPSNLIESPWRLSRSSVSKTAVWLERWLLFRLIFFSGASKLLSGDPTWRNRTALLYHYWTQPLPTPVAWYAAQLPAWFQELSVVTMFTLELGIPFLIFAPRRLRRIGAALTIGLQLVIALTGNYCFFNLLAIILCVLLLDDSLLRKSLPARLVNRLTGRGEATISAPAPLARFTRAMRVALALLIILISGGEILAAFGQGTIIPGFVREMIDRQAPFDLVNSYGLFSVMTTTRPEIVVEGSDDGETWQAYEFKYKPGDLARRLPWVAPYQPRLDWQMWFAALGSYQQNRWFVDFVIRLAQGEPEVTALLQKNPFPGKPPLYIRAITYDYHFTDPVTRKATGNWWRREREGVYFPEVSLRTQ